MYVIESGQVRICLHGEDGQELSVAVIGAGGIFGEMAVIDGLPRSASAFAMDTTSVLSLSRDRFWQHMRRMPRLAFNFLQLLSTRLRADNQQFDSLTLHVQARLAQKHGITESDGVRIDLALTQSDLAALLVTSRESINKAVRKFQQQGFIRQRQGQIIIVDSKVLQALNG